MLVDHTADLQATIADACRAQDIDRLMADIGVFADWLEQRGENVTGWRRIVRERRMPDWDSSIDTFDWWDSWVGRPSSLDDSTLNDLKGRQAISSMRWREYTDPYRALAALADVWREQ